MKRPIAAVVPAIGVPLTVLFVLTAGPARLYAETAPAPPVCSAPEITACDGKSPSDSCSLEAGTGACQSDLCQNADSGTNITSLRCRLPTPTPSVCAPQEKIDDCAGKEHLDPCGDAGLRCGPLRCFDGGTIPGLMCDYHTGGEGGVPTQIPKLEAGTENEAGATTKEAGNGEAGVGAAPTSSDDSGCSCNAAGMSRTPLGPGVGLILAAAAFVARARHGRRDHKNRSNENA